MAVAQIKRGRPERRSRLPECSHPDVLVAVGDECPTCHQPISAEIRRRIEEEQQQYLAALEARHAEIVEARIAQLEAAARERVASLEEEHACQREADRAQLERQREAEADALRRLEAEKLRAQKALQAGVAKANVQATRQLKAQLEKQRVATARAAQRAAREAKGLRRQLVQAQKAARNGVQESVAKANAQAARRIKGLEHQFAQQRRQDEKRLADALRGRERELRQMHQERMTAQAERVRTQLKAGEQARASMAQRVTDMETAHRNLLQVSRLKDERWQQRLDELQEKVRRQGTAPGDLGDAQQADLVEQLKERFPDDRIDAVQRGKAGADIVHVVPYKGEPCARILIESKAQQKWGGRPWIDKLLSDGRRHEADKLILVTSAFPATCAPGDFYECRGIYVARPAVVRELVALLRASLIHAHQHDLSARQRDRREALCLKYLSSDTFRRFREAEQERLRVDRGAVDQEESQHQKFWKDRRGSIEKREVGWREFDAQIAAILEATGLRKAS